MVFKQKSTQCKSISEQINSVHVRHVSAGKCLLATYKVVDLDLDRRADLPSR